MPIAPFSPGCVEFCPPQMRPPAVSFEREAANLEVGHVLLPPCGELRIKVPVDHGAVAARGAGVPAVLGDAHVPDGRGMRGYRLEPRL